MPIASEVEDFIDTLVSMNTWTDAVCYFMDLAQPAIECEDYRQAFDHAIYSV